MADNVIVASKMKEMISGMGCNTGGDVAETLNGMCMWLINEACTRTGANGRKTVRSYDFVASQSNDGASLAVASKVKEAIRAAGMNCGGDALDGLNAYLGWAVASAAGRAKANGRKTVRGHDVMVDQ